MESSEAIFDRLKNMVELAYEMRDLLRAGDLEAFGKALHRGWEMKREMSAVISTSAIDQVYDRALAAALGGKIAGAGGGGFLVLYCPKPAQPHVRKALSDLQSLDFALTGAARVLPSGNRSDRAPTNNNRAARPQPTKHPGRPEIGRLGAADGSVNR